ncbi:hypothetical protein JIN84_17860 [Luteolibacter yonseiensis]|uniref:Uncharacterized protein n=1 Tax=Luteolibacter yonseiensis TaxID=1144680 RepID=A0A934VCZ4_9BACT|nr:hypothetical protein [Luteolibacter yonseiensis]MBK1817491.1 hypothetical protein [Luteolibacter yonseiensis]
MIQLSTKRTNVTANEEYALPWAKADTDQLIEWDITGGSATVEIGVIGLTSAFRKLLPLDGVAPVFAASGGSCVVETPASGQVCVKVTSASSLAMVVSQTVKPRRK